MKKRILALLLVLAMGAGMVPSAAAAGGDYGKKPILIGDPRVDYLADEILREIPTEGLGDREKIQAVYDWIITHCKRYDWDGTTYFDEDTIDEESAPYALAAQERLDRREALLREELYPYLDVPTESSYYGELPPEDVSFDLNRSVRYLCYDMMLRRTGACTNFSALLIVLLGHLGYDCRMIAGDFINYDGSQVIHKWCCVLLDGQYYWLDVRIDHAYYESTGRLVHDYFLVESTEDWEADHRWDHTYSDQLFRNGERIRRIYEGTAEPENPENPEDPEKPDFQDVPAGSYCADAVAWAVEQEITRGVTPTEFRPDDSCTRGQVVTFLWRAAGSPAPDRGETPFTDVNPEAYYADAVAWAVETGVTLGTSDTTFSPGNTCTRGQVVTFLYRAMGSPAVEEAAPPFEDVNPEAFYYGPMLWALEAGVTNGISRTAFAPGQTCTRGQVVTFLHRCRETENR